MTRTEVGMLLARARIRAGMTQSKLAEAMETTQPVVARAARQFNFEFVSISFDDPEEDWWMYPSTWVLLSHNRDIIHSPAICAAAETIKTNASFRLWTDDFVSLFPILKK